MSEGIVPHEDTPTPTGAGAQVLQKVGVISAKAAISSIPGRRWCSTWGKPRSNSRTCA
ncbi:hypothetical protein SAMN05192568_106810 [Methylobacterium pseudosasicola]|uniref:Uncharacterized protein n=1 Tax=Methylobacterium pseudosasicola TaxID=582667 RepID=A0A1I4UDB9_9HYPH|nr:hypothetical protein SAMN05192568_106810 [Methylobacterium pseudosasicola]